MTCDDCPDRGCASCAVYRRQDFEYERAKAAVKRRVRSEAVKALIARRLAEYGEPEWRPTKGIAA